MYRLYLIALFICALACPATIAPTQAEDNNTRPNIVIVFTDDHARHAISAYGSKINETPHLDRLAREGMLFENAFVTNALCGPSRAVLLTGKHSHINGFRKNGDRFDGDQPTFPKMLRRVGYTTAIIGKWHLTSDPQGFDHWDILPGQGHYYNPDFINQDGRYNERGYVTDIITDKVISWIDESRGTGKPFMVMYNHKAPHREWEPGPAHLKLYQDVQIPEPATLFDNYEGRSSAARTQTMSIAHDMFSSDLKLPLEEHAPDFARNAKRRTYDRLDAEQRAVWDEAYREENEAFRKANLEGRDLVRWKYQRYIKDYLRTIASVDDNLGRLLNYLDETGLAENTIVIYASDQGFYLGDHGWYDKRFMYEESFTFPLMVRWPGKVKPNSRSNHLVSNLDLAPTLLDMAGVDAPDDMQGRSLVPLLRGVKPDDWRNSVYYHYYEFPAIHSVQRHYGIRTDRYKLIHFYQLDEWELFDLEKDPHELRSVYSEPQYATIRKQLKQELRRLQQFYKDPIAIELDN